jgi:putative endonuclease
MGDDAQGGGVIAVVPAQAGTHNHKCEMDVPYYVYILASKRYGTLYIGVTNSLHNRMQQHRLGLGSEFVKKYNVHRLVYVEPYERVEDAIRREKQLKKWNRDWKIRLIEEENLEWQDLTHLIA